MGERLWGRAAYAPLVVVFALAFLPTCGGGGGGSEPVEIPTIDLGVLSATTPSVVSRTFTNPLGAPATVTSPPFDSPFSIDPSDLPAQVQAGGTLNLAVRFEPTAPGPHTGPLVLNFLAGSQLAQQTFEVTATGEDIPWTITPADVDFGDVLPDGERELEVSLRNESLRSPVTFTSGQFTSTAYAFVQSPFPLSVAPKQTRSFRVRFRPGVIANHDAQLRLTAEHLGGPFPIRLSGVSTGNGEQVIDLGVQTLTNGETPELTVDIPASAVSVAFEGVIAGSDQIGLLSLEGPGGKVYENTSGTGAVRWVPSKRSFSFHLPSSDEPETQLVSGGGTYRFRLHRVSGARTSMSVRVIVERRVGPSTSAVLPLNIFLADGLTPNAATAANDANLQSVITQVDQILSAQGVRLGDITYYDITDASLDAVSQGEEELLFQQGSKATALRLPLFLVKNVWDAQLLGLSGSIDGAKRQGDRVTGVVSLYFDAQPGAIAAVIAHEICHYLGLWHTAESDGTHDPILDTPNCPAVGTDGVCSVEGGDLLMHWQGNGGKTLTPGQGQVIRGHPFLHPPGAGGSALRAAPLPWRPSAATLEFLQSLPAGWCGTGR